MPINLVAPIWMDAVRFATLPGARFAGFSSKDASIRYRTWAQFWNQLNCSGALRFTWKKKYGPAASRKDGAGLAAFELAGKHSFPQQRKVTGYRERVARVPLAKLIERGLFVSDGPKTPVRLGFPLNVVERWFPALYPPARN
jgi:hypothetical protein